MGWWEVCAWSRSASEDASNSRLFRVATGISAVSSPHPHPHTHQGVASTSLDMPPDSVRPGAADIVSGWDSLTYPLWCSGRYEALKQSLQMDIPVRGWLVWLTAAHQPCVRLCAHVGENPAPKSRQHASPVLTPSYTFHLLLHNFILLQSPHHHRQHPEAFSPQRTGKRWLTVLPHTGCVSSYLMKAVEVEPNWASSSSGPAVKLERVLFSPITLLTHRSPSTYIQWFTRRPSLCSWQLVAGGGSELWLPGCCSRFPNLHKLANLHFSSDI